MKKELPLNIPQKRIYELHEIKQIILEVSQKIIRAEMIILFWSYARWDFVEKDVKYVEWHYEEYQSDFDILVVVSRQDIKKQLKLENKICEALKSRVIKKTPVSVIVEDVYHINKRLTEERYFYVDIEREWIALYDSKKYWIKKWKPLTEDQKIELKKEYFEKWFEKWYGFFEQYEFALSKKRNNIAAFLLHQSTESYIATYMLVKTWYKPKTHDLEKLYEMLVKEDEAFWSWFYLENEEEKRLFELLKTAYVDARYSMSYKIDEDELKCLDSKVLKLSGIVKKLCENELALC